MIKTKYILFGLFLLGLLICSPSCSSTKSVAIKRDTKISTLNGYILTDKEGNINLWFIATDEEDFHSGYSAFLEMYPKLQYETLYVTIRPVIISEDDKVMIIYIKIKSKQII